LGVSPHDFRESDADGLGRENPAAHGQHFTDHAIGQPVLHELDFFLACSAKNNADGIDMGSVGAGQGYCGRCQIELFSESKLGKVRSAHGKAFCAAGGQGCFLNNAQSVFKNFNPPQIPVIGTFTLNTIDFYEYIECH
jgi:hypothetical protein